MAIECKIIIICVRYIPRKFWIDDSIPAIATSIRSLALVAANIAGRISHATPSLGSGLIATKPPPLDRYVTRARCYWLCRWGTQTIFKHAQCIHTRYACVLATDRRARRVGLQ